MTREEAVDIYCAAWNEMMGARRSALLGPVCAEDATYTDPTVHLVGVPALVEHIGRVLERRPGSRIVVTSAIDIHHDVARFGWKRVLADGTSLPEGIDFVEFGPDDRLRRIVGFFGPLRPPS